MVSVFVSKQRCFLLLKRRLIPVQKIAIMTEKIHVGQKAWEFDTKNNSRNSSCFTVTSEAGEKVWDFQKKVKEMFNVF